MTFVLSSPERPRKLATKALASDLPLRLAEHMMKYAIMSRSTSRNHWGSEIKVLFKQLMVGVSSRIDTNLKTRKKKISQLHYPLSVVKEAIDDLSVEALDFVEDSKYASEYLDEDYNNQNIFECGWSISEIVLDGAIFWTLKYKSGFEVTVP